MQSTMVRRLAAGLSLAAVLAGCATQPAANVAALPTASEPPQRFNEYVLKAVDSLAQDPQRVRKGYGSSIFTQDLKFGNLGTLKSTKAPLTMCVAAQLEVLVEAMNIYAAEKQDYSPFKFLPKKTWERLKPSDLRGQIWIVKDAPSSGAADALKNFGMGEKVTFEELQPGDFVNLNRATGSGHGVIFLSYLDLAGSELATYSSNVAGFKYFSAQGNENDGGLDYRYAFFYPNCPRNLGAGKRVDCKVIRSKAQNLLNTGYVKMPSQWKTPSPSALEAAPEGEFDSDYFSGDTEEE